MCAVETAVVGVVRGFGGMLAGGWLGVKMNTVSGCELGADAVPHFLWARVWFPGCIDDGGSSGGKPHSIMLLDQCAAR